MSRETTEIVIDEYGDESHESWIRVTASKISSTGTRLFDSEITHSRFVRVSVHRCTRKRDLNRDWLHNTKLLCEFDMSEAQWGAFVSSFGDGGGVPATLTWLNGHVPSAPFESRLDESHREVREAADRSLEEIQAAYNDLVIAFNENHGKKAVRERIASLGARIGHAPSNMEFAAKSLTEHVENVVTKAKADIEGMVLEAESQAALAASTQHLLGRASTGEET